MILLLLPSYMFGVTLIKYSFLGNPMDNGIWRATVHGVAELDTAATAAKSLQLRTTLCDPIDSSPPGSPVPGILQTRTLEWSAISFSRESLLHLLLHSSVLAWRIPETGEPGGLPSLGSHRVGHY